MRSYLEIVNELTDAIESDNIDTNDKAKLNKLLDELTNVLWKYSD